MFAKFLVPALALFVAVPLVLAPVPASAQDTALKKDVTFSKEELDQILAPIALYPDDLLSNVLMASTYPLEVVQAARWVKLPDNANLKGEKLTKALEQKHWAPSVKSLVPFPEVLEMMSEQLEWTQKLGDAILADEAAVMDQIQFLREKADEAGHLKSNEHQRVTRKGSGGSRYIHVEPADPEIVYVPVYEPTVVYGSWWYPAYPPYYWPPWEGGAFVSGFYWGVGAAIVPPLWGWGHCNWGGRYININVNKYNRINVNRRKIRSNRWRHDGYHRRGVRYNNARARRRHAKHDIRAGRRKQLDYRGRSGKQVLKPGRDGQRGARPRPSEPLKAGGDRRRGVDRAKAGDRRRIDRPRVSRRSKLDKRPSAGSKKRRSTRIAKRTSARSTKQRRNRAFSNPRKRSSIRRRASRGRSGLRARRGGRRR
jgi:hypothetical protein